MNSVFQLVFSTMLLLQLATAAHVPAQQKLMNTRTTANRRALSNQIFNNFVEMHDPTTNSESDGSQSHTCVYYNYLDECHKSNDGCGEQTETCSVSGATMKSCYTLWRDNKKLLQGCWYPSYRAECRRGACIANSLYLQSFGYFCCCFGDKCNEYYTDVGNDIPDWP